MEDNEQGCSADDHPEQCIEVVRQVGKGEEQHACRNEPDGRWKEGPFARFRRVRHRFRHSIKDGIAGGSSRTGSRVEEREACPGLPTLDHGQYPTHRVNGLPVNYVSRPERAAPAPGGPPAAADLGTGVRVWGWRTWPLVQVALEVQDYAQAVSWAAQTALRDIIGRTTLADLPRGRERIEAELQ